MKPVEAVELSGLLDGELEPVRAAEVRGALEQDPALRAEFERLQRADSAWRCAADMAFARTRVSATVPSTPVSSWTIGVVLLAVLLIVRFLPKLLDLWATGLLMHLVVLGVVMVLVVQMSRQTEALIAEARSGQQTRQAPPPLNPQRGSL